MGWYIYTHIVISFKMRRLSVVFTVLVFCLFSCASNAQDQDRIEKQLKDMSLREKVGQLFIVRPEALDPTIEWTTGEELVSIAMQEVNGRMIATSKKYPVGGILLYAHNIDNPEQVQKFIGELRHLKGNPLICIDEEGGRVARIANNPKFHVPKFQSMAYIGSLGDPQAAFNASYAIGSYLKKYGFDIDLAPVADVNTNPQNVIIGARAFSDSPAIAAPMVAEYVKGLSEAGIVGCLKHFPGHGDTYSDTHWGDAISHKTWEEMLDCEMITFKAGIAAGVPMIMSAHISAPKVTGSLIPSTLSSLILQDKLRGELGFEGVIITDGMEMGAITQQYTSEEAAIRAILAGADILLGTREYPKVFEAVLQAVNDGTIPEARIDESVRRILRLRAQLQQE
jgi:beta-N-acetylhexosaminidase